MAARKGDGRWAEALAAAWLRLRGWRVLGRRVRTPAGEIDIIARKGRCVIFVEVKQRRRMEDALNALLPAQQRRIAAAAQCWLDSQPEQGVMELEGRFDLIAIDARGRLRHVRDAFQADTPRRIW